MSWIKLNSGKVRDMYFDPNQPDYIFVIASDRVSAFDKVIPDVRIPGKGRILAQMSRAWSDFFDEESLPFLTAYAIDPTCAPEVQRQLKLDMLPVECIVRGYITGSLWEKYQKGAREICGVKLRDGLCESEMLTNEYGDFSPIFTPTTKAPVGLHDEDITFEQMSDLIKVAYPLSGAEIAENVREYSLMLYEMAHDYAEERGIIIADTKFEFGIDNRTGKIFLADEILTPDSSRFWLANEYEVGKPQDSLDKQPIRDFIKAQRAAGVENIELPQELIDKTAAAYEKAYAMLFDEEFED